MAKRCRGLLRPPCHAPLNGLLRSILILAKRVWKAVDVLSFSPEYAGAGFSFGVKKSLGFSSSLKSQIPFFLQVVHAFKEIAVHNGYELLLTSTVYDSKRMELAVRRMIERRVEWVGIHTFGMEEALIEDMRYRKIPSRFVDVGPHTPGISNIRIDYQAGIHQAIHYLELRYGTRVSRLSPDRYS